MEEYRDEVLWQKAKKSFVSAWPCFLFCGKCIFVAYLVVYIWPKRHEPGNSLTYMDDAWVGYWITFSIPKCLWGS